jgi:hypothetical protein
MARNFEINIRLSVTSSQDTTAQQLEGHLRQPDAQGRIRDVVERFLPPLEQQERQEAVRYDCECTLVTVENV